MDEVRQWEVIELRKKSKHGSYERTGASFMIEAETQPEARDRLISLYGQHNVCRPGIFSNILFVGLDLMYMVTYPKRR